MKAFNTFLMLLFIAGIILPCSCEKEVSEEFVGTWETDLVRIEIPMEEVDGSEDIVVDSVVIGLQISTDKTASGYIGMASFTDVHVRKNPGDAESKGIAYILICKDLGKIFPGDPLETKRIDINLKPIHDNTMGSEINYISKWMEWFPFMIGDPEFHKLN
ncbi:hypothetical protein ACFLT1_06400 [Bacteroidota bacterium]